MAVDVIDFSNQTQSTDKKTLQLNRKHEGTSERTVWYFRLFPFSFPIIPFSQASNLSKKIYYSSPEGTENKRYQFDEGFVF